MKTADFSERSGPFPTVARRFKKRADNIRPYSNHDDTRRNKSLPCAKGGVANGDGGIVIPSR